MKPQSPTRLVMNAFLPAEALASFENQNETRKYEHVPTPSQPRNVTSRFEPSTSISIENTNRLRYTKNFENFGSPCMYPMEYRWISVPMPVTNSAIVIDSGSTRKPRSTWNPPAGSQVKSFSTWWRWSASLPRRATKTATRDGERAGGGSVASHPARGSPSRRPKASSTRKPASGSAGMSQTRSSIGGRYPSRSRAVGEATRQHRTVSWPAGNTFNRRT